ncbi:phage shock protein C (PspC) family protein [Geodermatophilus amargosae]|uniref:Phage shock protein C (PspC) family protein n=1 Tax=Geodermatophilus amargosae TaxID=1296565 RepID=A0A1I6Y1H2_9ACTN|nr:PspC domain-containing protein [Geodermatophilus amargosae]SFT44469.1 phage shock protein C (PspC) family protein [Geodermatophilus amargosae]
MTAPFPPPAPSLEPPPPVRPTLRRSRSDKMVGGVAGGLAEYSGVDPLLWRVGFVALTLAGGTGVLVYVLLLLLMPRAPRRAALDGAPAEPPGPRSPVAGLTVAGLLIAVGLMVLVTRYTDLEPGPRGFLATALLVVGLGLVASAVTRARAPRGGLIALGSVLTLALLFTSAVPTLTEDAGVGDREYQPATAEDVRPVYRLGAGDMDVDLSRVDVDDLDEPIEVRIEMGAGDLDVVVPADADVRIEVEHGIGETEVFGDSSGEGYYRAPGGDDEPEFVLSFDHGVGDLEVSRA